MLDSSTIPPVNDAPSIYSGMDLPDFGNPFKPLVKPLDKLDRPLVGDSGRHIEWAASLKDGISQAQSQGKPLICVFEEDNCGWCKKFDQELTKPEAVRLNENAIFVRVSPSKDPDGAALASNLWIDSYPTVSVLDIKGTAISERTRTTGFMSAGEFASHIEPSNTAYV